MTESFSDMVDRVLRDHEGYSGDGKGGVGALPVGDRSTARKPISKRDLRELLKAPASYAIAAAGSAEAASVALSSAQAVLDEAQSYATAAGTAAKFYDTVAAGRAAVADGETFGVLPGGPDGLEFPTIFRRDSAGSQTEIVSITPAALVLDEIDERSALITRTSNEKLLISDANGYGWAALSIESGFEVGRIRLNGSNGVIESEDGVLDLGHTKVVRSTATFTVTDPHGYALFTLDGTESGGSTGGGSTGATAAPPQTDPFPVEFCAHRGVTLMAPECSIEGVDFAARAGFDYVECDVRRTIDGHFVLMHDDTINRTCRNAADYSTISSPISVEELTLADLQSNYVLASSVVSQRVPVPTLNDWIARCRQVGIRPAVEIKQTVSDAEAVEVADAVIAGYGPRAVFLSFNFSHLVAIRSKYPDVMLWTLQAPTTGNISSVSAIKPVAYEPGQNSMTAANVALAAGAGLEVGCYSVSPNTMITKIKQGARLITADAVAPQHRGRVIRGMRGGYSDGWGGVVHTGAVVGGMLHLAEGQYVEYPVGGDVVAFGGVYADVTFSGTATITGSGGISSTHTHTKMEAIKTSALVKGLAPAVKLTAGPGGAIVSSITCCTARY